MMKEKIKIYLEKIEKTKGIKILLACETGSRAWGFPSPDSDYDIRMIYLHKKDWYLTLTEEKDSIEMMLENNDLDISGWELRKTLRLLKKSNPPLLERIQSPVLYIHNEIFLTEITQLAQQAYSRIATVHHYLSMGKKCLAEITAENKFKLKKFFYALRAAVACRWILEKDEMPPIEFCVMLGGLTLEVNLTARINELIKLKSTKSEAYLHQGETELIKFIEDCLLTAEHGAKTLPSGTITIDELNLFFRKMIEA